MRKVLRVYVVRISWSVGPVRSEEYTHPTRPLSSVSDQVKGRSGYARLAKSVIAAEFIRGLFLRDSLLSRSFLFSLTYSLAVSLLVLATSLSTIAASPSAVFLAISSFLRHNSSSLWFYFCNLSSKCNAFCTASFCFLLSLSFSACTHSALV